jgi:cbb3-type cytochrome oxidase subunit 3
MFKSLKLLAQAGSGSIDSYNAGSIKPGFRIPVFSEVMTFIIRGFFIVAGLIALLYLLLGALAWITSGGNKESVDKAREKIQAALIGIILIFAVLAIVGVVENILGLSLGVTKDIVFPKLIQN